MCLHTKSVESFITLRQDGTHKRNKKCLLHVPTAFESNVRKTKSSIYFFNRELLLERAFFVEVYNDDLWLPIANYYDLWPTRKKHNWPLLIMIKATSCTSFNILITSLSYVTVTYLQHGTASPCLMGLFYLFTTSSSFKLEIK